jgi:hypothetical protein
MNYEDVIVALESESSLQDFTVLLWHLDDTKLLDVYNIIKNEVMARIVANPNKIILKGIK